MKNIVINTIKKNNLILPKSKVMLALSGGSDSVCLLHILNDIKEMFDFELFACHVNHSLREEADTDEEFVIGLCKTLGIKCFVKKVDIKKISSEMKISEELAGRNERYKFFEEISEKNNIDLIATAHNKNDSAETILMHIIRGSGLDGLKGIAYKRNNIIRPLLDAEKSDIEQYCKNNNYKFTVDKTNTQTIYTRNKIRLELLPKICSEFNPSFVHTIVNNAALIKDDAEYLNATAEKIYNECEENGKLNIDKLKTLHISILRRIILIMYKRYFGNNINMQSVHTENILKLIKAGRSGKSVNINNFTRCVLENGKIYLKSSGSSVGDYSYTLKLNEKTYIPEADICITLKKWENDGEKIYFDSLDNICVRNRRRGDIFYPVGMKGRKKLSDYFIDCKISVSERSTLPIITFNNEIVWIVNKRRDRRFIKGKEAYTIVIN